MNKVSSAVEKIKSSDLTTIPKDLIISENVYALTADGIYLIKYEDGKKKSAEWVCSLIRVTAETLDEHGKKWGYLLEFSDKAGTQHRFPMSAETFKGTGEELRGALLSMGLKITTKPHLKCLVSDYLRVKGDKKLPIVRCINRTGWDGKNAFILPDNVIGDNEQMVIFQNAEDVKYAYSQKGSIKEWRENVSCLCAGNSRLVFALSMSFASPLLFVTGTENGGFNISGTSSTGKTTSLDVASSTSGNPEKYVQRWRATGNGIEAITANYNDSLLPLDELAQVDAKEAGEIAYMLANGQGKQRATKTGAARNRHDWRLLFLSAGEIGLADHMMQAGKVAKAGQEIRLADIPADAGAGMGLFEEIYHYKKPNLFADALKRNTRTYYGTAFPKFIEILITNMEAVTVQIDAVRNAFIEKFVPNMADGQVMRIAKRFSLVAAAGELATHFGITGWAENEAFEGTGKCFMAWLESWGGIENKESMRLLQQVRAFFESHGESRFSIINELGFRSTINRAGFRETNKDSTEFYVLPEAYKEICKGFIPKMATQVLIQYGIIEPGTGNKTSKVKNIPGMGAQRVYHFTNKVWDI